MAATVMRSMLSVPGIRERFIEKARDAEADVLCFDLEDSTSPSVADRCSSAPTATTPG